MLFFGFLDVEENVSPWYERKDYFLVWKESLFLGVQGKFISC